MITVQTKKGQSLLDIAMQYIGSAQGAVEIAILNNLSLTHDIASEQTLQIDLESIFYDKQHVEYFKRNALNPATALSEQDKERADSATLGWSILEKNFKVH